MTRQRTQKQLITELEHSLSIAEERIEDLRTRVERLEAFASSRSGQPRMVHPAHDSRRTMR